MGNHIHIIGGGTFSHVRSHLAIAAPAFGGTARRLYNIFHDKMGMEWGDAPVHLHLTKMADPASKLVTNQDVSDFIDALIANPKTRVIILNAALCDYDGFVMEDCSPTPSGKYGDRLKSRDGDVTMLLTPADKLIARIRQARKDIFVVGFKTTTGEQPDSQYAIALNALKRDSLNLVMANDTVTRRNMIVAPEETRYADGKDRMATLATLVDMVLARSSNTFTRSTVVGDENDSVAWDSELVPANLREVVNHCIERGAYKTFRGVTAGHFAVRVGDKTILTSKRKRDFNKLSEIGLVRVDYDGVDRVIAHGAKPSVGGQSQRIVFDEHPSLDCIVHFHSPMRDNARDAVPVANQWPHECGSHQCGANTSRNLKSFGDLEAVMLDGHGPNIVFSRDTPPEKVIDFIEANFDLAAKTGGLVSEPV
jgi:hypothetical protein